MSTNPLVNTLYTYKGYNMKKLLTVLLLTVSATAFAQHNHGWRHHGHRAHGPSFGYWLAPVVIGGVVGAAIANNNRRETIIVEQQPIVVQPLQQNCTAWKEVQTSEGNTYRERTCYGLQ